MRASFLFILSVSLGAQANADDDAWNMLQKAAVAARALSYEGIFVCQTNQKTRAVQITHIFNGKNEFARNIVLDGSPREVLSQGEDLVIYNPRNEKVIIEKRRGQNMFPAILPLNLEPVKENYVLYLGAQERVADRQAQILNLEPKDGLRYSYRFWIDTEFGLLLKSVLFNRQREIIENIAFNQLSMLNKVDLDWFKPKIDHEKKYVMEDEQVILPDAKFPVTWTIKELPAGYHKVTQMHRMVPGKPYPVMHVVFSDGLASVSLFIEPAVKNMKSKGRESKAVLIKNGNTSFYANENNGYLVTAVGEVPEATVVQIANAIMIKSGQSKTVELQ